MPISKVPTIARGGALLLLTALVATGCDRGDRPDQLGRPAPQIALNDGQHTVNLHDLRGHVVLLNFWASWCAPCIAEMPSLEQLQLDVPQVKIVLIAFDEDPATYAAYLQRHPLPLLSVLDTAGVAHTRFGTFRPPESYLLDKTGTIRRKFIGAQDWTSPEIEDSLRKLAARR